MSLIKVTAKIGNTTHPKYGTLVEGEEYTIAEEDFGDEIFSRDVASPLVGEVGEGGDRSRKSRGGSKDVEANS